MIYCLIPTMCYVFHKPGVKQATQAPPGACCGSGSAGRAMPEFHQPSIVAGGIMQNFDLVNVLIIVLAAVALIAGAVLHKRALKKALIEADKLPVRGLRRYRQQ